MSIMQAILLGAIQGLTEFIPVSSSGHVLVAGNLFNIPTSFEIETLLNIGTLLAAIVYFRIDIRKLFQQLLSSRDGGLGLKIIIATIPLLVGGVIFDQFLADTLRGSIITTIMLAVVGALMIAVKPGSKTIERLSTRNAITVGVSQVLALIPGTSRSGITILTGMRQGFNAAAAARFSFLLSIPAVGAAVVYTWFSLVHDGVNLANSTGVLIAGNVAAFVTSLLAIHGMISFLKKSGLSVFGWYRIGLAGILLITILIS